MSGLGLLAFLTAVLAVILASPSAVAWWQRRHPFWMRVAEQPYEPPLPAHERTYADRLDLGQGSHVITLGVQTRREVTLRSINVRFVERNWLKFWGWKDLDVEAAQICDLNVPVWKLEEEPERDFSGLNTITKTQDGHGGYNAKPRKPKPLAVNEWLWLVISVEANRSCQGALRFEGLADRRAYAKVWFLVRCGD